MVIFHVSTFILHLHYQLSRWLVSVIQLSKKGTVEGPSVAVRDGDSAELADQRGIPLQMDKPAAVCTGREIVAFAAGFPVNEDTLACADISGMLFT